MNRRDFIRSGVVAAAGLGAVVRAESEKRTKVPETLACDVFVYGSTPGGVAAAVEAARGGAEVVLACPKNHPGGMAASGLCTTDAVRREMFGGLVIEFVDRVRAIYGRTIGRDSPEWPLIRDGWFYAPSVAEQAFHELLEAEAERIDYRRRHELVAVRVDGARIAEATIEDSEGRKLCIAARTFIDGTYEGDLAGAAGVPYRVGREGRDEFDEPLAGIHYMNFRTGQQIV
ncbi:MAG: FAD-dependent oxidoreductase, partial [Thermoguttaceae bacterium]|nr:FAD-dependent oxidoreductase [Thermoguttaceae bacterium]